MPQSDLDALIARLDDIERQTAALREMRDAQETYGAEWYGAAFELCRLRDEKLDVFPILLSAAREAARLREVLRNTRHEHDTSCPRYGRPSAQKPCDCGADDKNDELREALAPKGDG